MKYEQLVKLILIRQNSFIIWLIFKLKASWPPLGQVTVYWALICLYPNYFLHIRLDEHLQQVIEVE